MEITKAFLLANNFKQESESTFIKSISENTDYNEYVSVEFWKNHDKVQCVIVNIQTCGKIVIMGDISLEKLSQKFNMLGEKNLQTVFDL